jgi:hypothetical protein
MRINDSREFGMGFNQYSSRWWVMEKEGVRAMEMRFEDLGKP